MTDPSNELGVVGRLGEGEVKDAAAGAAGSGAAAVPLLPPPDPSSERDASIPRIRLGESISFEEMGPVIINADGTTRRIDNWDEMTDEERRVAWRRISKRNEERRQKLLLQQQQERNPEQALEANQTVETERIE
jgi:predicted Fe-S protein YdhL (DUF1289 family)